MELSTRPSSTVRTLVGALAIGAAVLMGVAVLILAASVQSCGSSATLVNVWKDPEYPSRPLSRLLVVNMSKDPARRRLWEDEFVHELEKRDVDATPSYRLFANDLPDTQQIIDEVQRSGFDGVIMAVRLPTETETHYVPGYVATVPVTRYNPWSDAYFTYWRDVYRPGYDETERVVRTRTDVWSTEGRGRLVWTGTSEVYDPSSGDQVRTDIAKRLIPELAKQDVINGRS